MFVTRGDAIGRTDVVPLALLLVCTSVDVSFVAAKLVDIADEGSGKDDVPANVAAVLTVAVVVDDDDDDGDDGNNGGASATTTSANVSVTFFFFRLKKGFLGGRPRLRFCVNECSCVCNVGVASLVERVVTHFK